MPLGVWGGGILRECGDREALCGGGVIVLLLEHTGVQSYYPHREQSHQQSYQQYSSRDRSLDNNSCRICCLHLRRFMGSQGASLHGQRSHCE